MKKLNFSFLILMAIGLFFAACTKEEIKTETDEVLTLQEAKAQLQPEMDQYMLEHDEVSIEHTSLENLNQALIAEGLESVTLEELGISLEKYDQAQANIKSETAAERCSGSWAVFLGDMNGSGTLSTLDVVLMRKCRLLISCNDPQQWLYSGYMSWFWGVDTNSNPTSVDEDTAIQIILGLEPCL